MLRVVYHVTVMIQETHVQLSIRGQRKSSKLCVLFICGFDGDSLLADAECDLLRQWRYACDGFELSLQLADGPRGCDSAL